MKIATAPFKHVKRDSDARTWAPSSTKMDAAAETAVIARCDAIRDAVQQLKIARVTGVRLYHKMFAAVRAGVTVADATDDLLLTFAPDEKRRVMDAVKRAGV